MDYIKPRHLKWNYIRDKAEEFRKKYVDPPDLVPVPIFDIVEISLEIEIIPKKGLRERADIDGFLSNDLKTIFIDEGHYMNPYKEPRLRFTYAHETGHLLLHKDEIEKCQFRTEEDWIHFREDMLEDDLNWFEQQAYEFAGRLLVPKERLIQKLKSQKDKIEQFRSLSDTNSDNMLIEAISRVICKDFGVSDEVICRRIRSEKLWEELKL